MNLDKFIGKTLEKIKLDAAGIKKLLAAAKRNIADAHVTEVSTENRFDAGYKAIMQLANAVLQANGYRTLTSKPGHHIAMIQSFGNILKLDKKTIAILDTLRKQRNLADYSGDSVPESSVKECIARAEDLFQITNRWLAENKPELLK
jgi:uncharacterized protein (UPF0332 family)